MRDNLGGLCEQGIMDSGGPDSGRTAVLNTGKRCEPVAHVLAGREACRRSAEWVAHSTDQKVGGSSPSERARSAATSDRGVAVSVAKTAAPAKAGGWQD